TFLTNMKTTRQTIKPLIDQNLISLYQEEVYRHAYDDENIERNEPLELKPQQQSALDKIIDTFNQEKHDVFVLHGVTGSGKTEVYLQAIAHVIEQEKEAI